MVYRILTTVGILQLILGAVFSLSLDRSPVPIPGRCPMPQEISPGTWNPQQRTLTDCPGFALVEPKGEGYCGPTAAVGATDWIDAFCYPSAKRGHRPPMDFGPSLISHAHTTVTKRSFRRACKRALKWGTAGYHGRTWCLQDFPPGLIAKLRASNDAKPEHVQITNTAQNKRIRIFHWNPGGLSQGRFIELRLWLQEHPQDIAILTETRWSFESTWSDDTWHYIHSPASASKTGGILIMISVKLATPNMIGFETIQAGRLLHARIHFERRAMDILAVYQHVQNHHRLTSDLRSTLWNQLDNLLSTLPNRNLLVCAGDFNCNLPAHPPWTGPNSYRWRGHRVHGHPHVDHMQFMKILQHHGLVVLNSWDEKAGPTYTHGLYSNRIDYFLTRSCTCDGQAKAVTHWHDSALLPVAQTFHVPIQCSLKKCHMAFVIHPQMTACTYAQRASCRTSALTDDDQWQVLTQTVRQTIENAEHFPQPERVIESVHDEVTPVFHALYPKSSKGIITNKHTAVHATIRTKWDHVHALRRVTFLGRLQPLRGCFHVWYHWSCSHMLQRKQQRQARQIKQRRFMELCHEVTRVAQQHDTHGMFAIINKYAPKKPFIRTRLRTDTGRIADQLQSHKMIAEYVRRTWQGPEFLPSPSDAVPGIPFSCAELIQAIAEVHPNKSVAAPFLPAVVWRSDPAVTAAFLMGLLQTWWHQTPPVIPQCWRDSWLFFLPKPGKPNTHPSHLRPISLMEPLGKIVMGLLAKKLKAALFPVLSRSPHFGFLPMRAATDAINRVALHCKAIRTLVSENRRTVAQQMQHSTKRILCGGISLFLDMTMAFDSVDRQILFQHMADMGTPISLQRLIRTWHEQTHYNLVFRGETYPIQVGRGVRQGCKIAPLLWLIYMDLFLTRLAELAGPNWVKEHVTLYADDIHIGCRFLNPAEFSMHLRHLGHALDVLESLQLTLSYTKSFVILAATGTNPRHTLKGVIQRHPTGASVVLPRAAGTTLLPLRSKGVYLGVVMSYRTFEEDTWIRRKHASWTAFHRLRPWFKAQSIPVKHRIYLWHTCVHSVMTYGILAVQLTHKIFHDYQSQVYRNASHYNW